MDRQLKGVLDIFHSYNIAYWLDSGTLLAMMRDGKLLEHDEDIDISVWSSQVPKLREVIPHFRKAGYRIFTASYNGELFKYKLTPPDLTGQRIVDINIYREAKDHAWSPMYYFNYSPSTKKTENDKKTLPMRIRSCIRSCWKAFNTKVAVNVAIDRLPWRTFVNTCTWWIPSEYFSHFVRNRSFDAYIPDDWEAYLEFRYGNWREPQLDWVFYRDDNGIKNTKPENLL